MGRERGPVWVLLGLAPLLGLGVLLAAIVLNGAGIDREDRPPVEDLTIDRVLLPTPDEIVVRVTNGGPEPVSVSQVTVNEALWDFRVEPDATIPPLGSAEISLPYSWVEGEAYGITLITATGTTFSAEVPAAVITPTFSAETFWRYALIGTYVGVIPVALGLLWYPFLRRLGSSGMNFVLALTVGLLAFLVIDTLEEGMAIGAAFALGEAALGVFLVVGFTLHNITEGVGIAAPILRERPSLAHFVWLALLGGGPAILGTWIGGFAFSNLLAAVFLAVGAGAIFQGVYEVTRLLLKDSTRSKTPALSASNLGGLLVGVAIMYATALLV